MGQILFRKRSRGEGGEEGESRGREAVARARLEKGEGGKMLTKKM